MCFMNINIKILLMCLLVSLNTYADVYVVIFATHNGKTGHAGIAIDNYQILNYEKEIDNQVVNRYDTTKVFTLTYFDLWPKSDSKSTLLQTLPAEYNLLPGSSSEPAITVESLINKGLPHRNGYLADGILKIKTTPTQDFFLKEFIKQLIDEGLPFNTRTHNCTDFCLQCINYLTDWDITAKELILTKRSNTPNKLYKALVKKSEVEIEKDAGRLVRGSFMRERVIEGFFRRI